MNHKIIAKIGAQQYLLKNLHDADGLLNILGDAIELESGFDTTEGNLLTHYKNHPSEISITLCDVNPLTYEEVNQRNRHKHPKPTIAESEPDGTLRTITAKR